MTDLAKVAKEAANRRSHKHIELIGQGELEWCKDCCCGEIELFEHSCEEQNAIRKREIKSHNKQEYQN